MRKLNKSTTLLIILSLVFLCANQSSNAAQNKSYTKPAKSTSTPSTKSSSAGEKDGDQTEMDKTVMAIQAGDIDKVQAAITATPGLVKKKDRNGRDLLYYAITGNQKDIAELLLHKGSNINDKNVNGEPVIFLLRYANSGKDMSDMMKLLIDNGADIKQTDKHKRSILHEIWQMRINNTNTISLLIANGDVNAKDDNGSTPLHITAGSTDIKIVDVAKMLLARGADINAKNNFGDTPLHRASAAVPQNKNMVIFLIEQGADLNAKNKSGLTPYSLAIESRNPVIVKVLEEKGAK